MNAPLIRTSSTGKSGYRRGLIASAAISLTALAAGVAQAAVPSAGSFIGNQAFATYDNGTGQQQNAQSNIVRTEVLPVYDILLEPGSQQQVSPGGEVKWSHTLTNLGNDEDVVLLELSNEAGDFDLTNVAVFLDQNQDGVPDDTNNLAGQTLPIDVNDPIYLVVIANAPNTATNNQIDTLILTATSQNDTTATDSDTNTAIVKLGGVVSVAKSIVDDPQGRPETQDVTMRIVITNTGNDAATSVTVTDAIPAGMTYTPGTASINVVAGGAVTDSDDALEPGGANNSTIPVSYQFDAGNVIMNLDSLAVGEVVELTFDVSIDAGVTAGEIINTANLSYEGGGEVRLDEDDASYTVLSAPGVTITGDTQGPFTEGATVELTNVITNDGTTADDYDIVVDLRIGEADGYPVGTTFQLLVDGAPLVSNDNNNAFPDINVDPGQTRNIILRITLPTDIDVSTPPAGGYLATKTAISLTDSNVTSVANDVISVIEPAVVDLTNTATNLNDSGVDGTGPGEEATPVSTVTGAPGETVTLELVVTNANNPASGSVADNYALSVDAITANPGGLGSDWVVRFEDAGGNEITSTPDIAAGDSYPVFAQVTIPANELATVDGTTGTPIVFRLESANSGAIDAKLDSVIVATVREVTLEENDAKQTFPGGVVIYSHTLTNSGNVAEPEFELSVTDSNLVDYVNSTIYLDVNNNGVIDGGDIINPTNADLLAYDADGSFDPNDSIPLLVRVQAQSGANPGAQNVTTLTTTVTGTVNGSDIVIVDGNPTNQPASTSNEDTTTIVVGDIELTKAQAVDADCDGVPETAYTDVNIQAEPGQCIVYQVTATNTGTRVAENLVITDAMPQFTTYNGGAGADCSGTPNGDGEASVTKGTITTTNTCGSVGQISADVGQLLPTEAAVVMSFSVKINDQ